MHVAQVALIDLEIDIRDQNIRYHVDACDDVVMWLTTSQKCLLLTSTYLLLFAA